MNKTPIQKLINGKPSEFARRIGCPKSTANHYSDGTRTPPEWVYRMIEYVLDCGYDVGKCDAYLKSVSATQRAERVLRRCINKAKRDAKK